jgi:hypothetical protein
MKERRVRINNGSGSMAPTAEMDYLAMIILPAILPTIKQRRQRALPPLFLKANSIV